MSREKEARKRHNNGYSCSSSVYSTFSDLVSGTAPFPRSEGGKCGAVLSAEKILQQLGMSSAEFDEKFIRQFDSLKCGELRKSRVPCNDLVGIEAQLECEADFERGFRLGAKILFELLDTEM